MSISASHSLCATALWLLSQAPKCLFRGLFRQAAVIRPRSKRWPAEGRSSGWPVAPVVWWTGGVAGGRCGRHRRFWCGRSLVSRPDFPLPFAPQSRRMLASGGLTGLLLACTAHQSWFWWLLGRGMLWFGLSLALTSVWRWAGWCSRRPDFCGNRAVRG